MNRQLLVEGTVLLIIFLPLTAQQCPAGFNLAQNRFNSSWCFKAFGNVMWRTFCEATKICHDNNLEIVSSKPVILALIDSGLITTSTYWIGLTDALNERGHNKSGWVWMKDGSLTADSDGLFNSNEPDNQNGEDCVAAYLGLLSDTSCKSTWNFMCYTNTDGSSALSDRSSRTAEFDKSPIVSFEQPDPGCWTDESLGLITSRQMCSARCFALGTDCVGFYWNSVRRQCIALWFFDASVQLGFQNNLELSQWEKFTRTSQ